MTNASMICVHKILLRWYLFLMRNKELELQRGSGFSTGRYGTKESSGLA